MKQREKPSVDPWSALPLARVALRVLVILNWVYGAIVFAILVGMFTAARWMVTALGFAPSADPAPLIVGVRMISALGLVGVPLNFIVLSHLLAMVNTVCGGDPFVHES